MQVASFCPLGQGLDGEGVRKLIALFLAWPKWRSSGEILCDYLASYYVVGINNCGFCLCEEGVELVLKVLDDSFPVYFLRPA